MTNPAILIVAVWSLGAPGPTPASRPAPRATIQVTGVGYPPAHISGPRARMMALRAAEVVAQRNLAAELARLSTINRAAATSRRLSARIAGFRYVAQRDRPDGSVEVTIEWSASAARVRVLNSSTSQPVPGAAVRPVQLPRPAVTPASRAQLRDLRRRIEYLERELGQVRALLRRLEPQGASAGAGTQPASNNSPPGD
ncbi:MAG: hypothetical protein GY778_23080 [bacterium]|nr:hypothetical protein [bacterium]